MYQDVIEEPNPTYEDILEKLKTEFPLYIKDNYENMKLIAYEISKGSLSMEIAKAFIKKELKFLGEQ